MTDAVSLIGWFTPEPVTVNGVSISLPPMRRVVYVRAERIAAAFVAEFEASVPAATNSTPVKGEPAEPATIADELPTRGTTESPEPTATAAQPTGNAAVTLTAAATSGQEGTTARVQEQTPPPQESAGELAGAPAVPPVPVPPAEKLSPSTAPGSPDPAVPGAPTAEVVSDSDMAVLEAMVRDA